MRLSRLTQGGPATDLEIGWLVELDVSDDEPLLTGPRLADSLRDMRLLGLQPTVLAPHEPWTNGGALRQPPVRTFGLQAQTRHDLE